ncbi:hypothetical protein ACFWY9_26040 [Amycolatopsis sp. NPDC059027]|uniref:hypothetical protein n=1 Tax=Amycolatopsis sp. NPDC059027 TaxID=3346709 RepID=UPI00366BF9B5
MKRLIGAAAVAIIAALLGACSSGGGTDMKPTMTEQQAQDRIEQYITAASSALPATAQRKLNWQNRSECADPTDKGPRGRFEVSTDYEIVGLDRTSFPAVFNAVVEWWNAHGFTVLTDNRPQDQYVFARNNTDAFDMSIKANDLGKLYLGATSTCVWPNGTPAPQAQGDSKETTEAVAAPPAAPDIAPTKAKRPRRPALDEYVEDFEQTDWTDEQHY